jgi:hypothetical protein
MRILGEILRQDSGKIFCEKFWGKIGKVFFENLLRWKFFWLEIFCFSLMKQKWSF